MDRRSFIKSSSLVGYTLVIGFSTVNQEVSANPSELSNPWLTIHADNTVNVLSARSEMGQDVYTTMVMLIAEELDYPIQKIKVDIAPTDPKFYINELLGGQITGGSTSVREAWKKLRVVGASAKELLVAAAAQKWNVDPKDCSASNGVVTCKGKSATYGELAGLASTIKPSGNPKLKDPSQYKYIGKPVARLDTPAKVRGTAKYGIDVRQPNMLVASLAQCPVIGGKVKSFDDSKARAVKGVDSIVQIPDGIAVLAKDFYTAKKARDLIQIQWDIPNNPAMVNMSSIEESHRKASTAKGAVVGKQGNFEDPIQGTAKQLTAEYKMPYAAHATLEPVNCAASVANGECHVWGPIQFQQGATGAAVAASGLPESQVHIHTTFLGGGYGRKLELDFISQAVAISKASGKPVHLIWTREDDMTHDFYRPFSLHQLSGGLDSSGKLVGLSSKMTSQSVTARAFPPFVVNGNDPFMNEGSANLTYDIKNWRAENVIHDPGTRVGYWRAVSNNLNTFAIESFIDELAKEAGKDPVKFRLEMLDKQPRAQKVLKAATEKAGWGLKRSNNHFLGVAQTECYGAYIAVVAEVSMNGDIPKVHKLTCAVDPGIAIRPDQVKAQIESGLLLGYSTAMKNKITFNNGAVEQSNFNNYPLLRMSETPQIDITILASGDAPSGMGEVGVPLAAPAIANAIASATGKRIRSLPFLA